jgi:hypothetical protein
MQGKPKDKLCRGCKELVDEAERDRDLWRNVALNLSATIDSLRRWRREGFARGLASAARTLRRRAARKRASCEMARKAERETVALCRESDAETLLSEARLLERRASKMRRGR